MGENVSILISAKDNFSDSIKKMSTATKAFDKTLNDSQSKLDLINKTKATFKIDVDKAKLELKAAQKAFEKTGSAADKLKLIDKQIMFDNATKSLNLLKKSANDAEKEILNLSNTSSRAGNKASTLKTSSLAIGAKGMFGLIGAAGAVDLAKSVGAAAFDDTIGSRYGTAAGNVIGQAAGQGLSGAALGFSLAGPIGAAVVGGVSAALGGLNASIENKKERDSNFKNVVQSRYDSTQQSQANTLKSGSELAASRETSLQSFTTMFKDADVAQGFFDEMKDFANVTPFLFDDLSGMAKTLKTYNYDVAELKPTMQKIGDAGAALGMNQADMNMVATSLGRMRSTGKTSTEYLNLLMERGIPAFDYLSKSLGKSKAEITEMVSGGLIPGADAARIISESMGTEFAGSMERQSKTFAGLASTLQGMNDEMNAAMGEAYNKERSLGMQNEIAFKQGDGGKKTMEANALIGQFKGSLENLKGQIAMDMQDAVMSGLSVEKYGPEISARLAGMSAEYKKLAASGKAEDGAKMGALLAEAQVIAENEYLASDGAQLEKQSQLGLIASIRNDTAIKDEYYNAGYDFGVEFSKGIRAASNAVVAALSPSGDSALDQNDPYIRDNINAKPYWESSAAVTDKREYMGSFATGLRRVPYNNFPARLHEGERILTAAEARAHGGGNINVNISGTYNVREEADIEKIAQTFARKLQQAQAVNA